MKIKLHPQCDGFWIHDGHDFARYERAQLEEVIRFTRPPSIAGFTVEFLPQIGSDTKWTSARDGKTYRPFKAARWSGRCYADANAVVIRVPIYFLGRLRKPLQFAGERDGAGYLGVCVNTPEEALVFLVAHELRHLWQKAVPRGWRVWGARGRYSERDCDAFGLAAVRRWRRRVFHVEQNARPLRTSGTPAPVSTACE